MKNRRILIIEDDKDIHELIKYHLTREGYDVISLFDGDQAIETVEKFKPHLVILDVMLPVRDGLDICRLIKANPALKDVLIIMLTAKSDDTDTIIGLQLGADEYMGKPFSPKVLMARIKALLRRFDELQLTQGIHAQLLTYGELCLDKQKRKVTYQSVNIDLTTVEFDILFFLCQHPGRVFTREELLDNVWKEGKFIIDRAVDVHIRSLRKKLGSGEHLIETVRGVGYRIKELEES
jgi:DNA-binding response OmpR family regulator